MWVAFDPGELQRVAEAWRAPSYADLELDGLLANELPAWRVLRAPVRIAVRDLAEDDRLDRAGHQSLRERPHVRHGAEAASG